MYAKKASLWPPGKLPEPAFCAEDKRLSVLAAHGTDTLVADAELQGIAAFAAQLCDTPIALVTVVEEDSQRFLARIGLDAESTPRPTSFCAHAMLGGEAMIVPDAAEDPRFADNPLVTGSPHIRLYAGYPLISSEGAPLGSLCVIDDKPRPEGLSDLQAQGLAVLAQAVMRRLGQRRVTRAAESAVASRETQLRRMIDSVPGIAFSADARGNFDYFNARWTEITGTPPPANAANWVDHLHPEDFAAGIDRWRGAVANVAPYEDRWRLRQADGSWRWTLARVVPVQTEDDGTVRWFGALVDVHEAQREAEARELLASELSHRIKNIFAVVSGLIALRARGRAEVADFAAELNAAIRALGTAHDYVRPDSNRRSDKLADLLGDLLSPYDGAGESRVEIGGDPVAIGSRAATPLALIFHELATNSAKYGALAHADGTVAVKVIAPCGDETSICVDWTETVPGGLDADRLGEESFGSRLLRMAVEGQLGGQFTRELAPDGLTVRIEVPEDSLKS